MKKVPYLIIFILANYASRAQYYYKDIVSNTRLQAEMQIYKAAKIKTLVLTSFEDNGEKSEGFFCTKKISKDYKKTTLFTRADMAPASLLTSIFDDEGRLLKSTDSSNIIVKNMQYKYDDKKRLVEITSYIRSKDEDFENSITETHLYNYTNDTLTQMKLIKNNKDTTLILFYTDENGNVALEKNTTTGLRHYYYFDDKNLLTDIVPSTNGGQRPRPDYIFDYNSKGLITQMTAVEEGSNNYFVWKYKYADGLRTKESCYTNERRLMGSIEYEYK